MTFAIGIENSKWECNVGTLWRSAYNFNAAMLFTIGRRWRKQASDTTATSRHIPLIAFRDLDDLREHMPRAWTPVAVEICKEATSLPDFKHPKQAVYILGPEDAGVSKKTAAWCKEKIVIPSRQCLNVAVAGAIVMYDRQCKGATR
jgi:tRNA G18 (ribose-2'-O)-methylase SpoU